LRKYEASVKGRTTGRTEKKRKTEKARYKRSSRATEDGAGPHAHGRVRGRRKGKKKLLRRGDTAGKRGTGEGTGPTIKNAVAEHLLFLPDHGKGGGKNGWVKDQRRRSHDRGKRRHPMLRPTVTARSKGPKKKPGGEACHQVRLQDPITA